jgi:hypothetical protein
MRFRRNQARDRTLMASKPLFHVHRSSRAFPAIFCAAFQTPNAHVTMHTAGHEGCSCACAYCCVYVFDTEIMCLCVCMCKDHVGTLTYVCTHVCTYDHCMLLNACLCSSERKKCRLYRYINTCICTYIHTYIYTHTYVCILGIYTHNHIHTHAHTYIHTYMHTYIPSLLVAAREPLHMSITRCIHTYIHTINAHASGHIHIQTHAYIHTYHHRSLQHTKHPPYASPHTQPQVFP